MLRYSPDVNSRVGALLNVASGGREDICSLLLDNCAPVNAQNEYGKTALLKAASCGHEPICRLLLARGADLSVRSYEEIHDYLGYECDLGNQTVLGEAAKEGRHLRDPRVVFALLLISITGTVGYNMCKIVKPK